jgi:hypothetical protein
MTISIFAIALALAGCAAQQPEPDMYAGEIAAMGEANVAQIKVMWQKAEEIRRCRREKTAAGMAATESEITAYCTPHYRPGPRYI